MDTEEIRRLTQAARDSLERMDVGIARTYLDAVLQELE